MVLTLYKGPITQEQRHTEIVEKLQQLLLFGQTQSQWVFQVLWSWPVLFYTWDSHYKSLLSLSHISSQCGSLGKQSPIRILPNTQPSHGDGKSPHCKPDNNAGTYSARISAFCAGTLNCTTTRTPPSAGHNDSCTGFLWWSTDGASQYAALLYYTSSGRTLVMIKNYKMNREMTRLEQKIDVSRTTQMLERALISIFAVTIMAMASEQSHLWSIRDLRTFSSVLKYSKNCVLWEIWVSTPPVWYCKTQPVCRTLSANTCMLF